MSLKIFDFLRNDVAVFCNSVFSFRMSSQTYYSKALCEMILFCLLPELLVALTHASLRECNMNLMFYMLLPIVSLTILSEA